MAYCYYSYTPVGEEGEMLNRNMIMGLITLGVLLAILATILIVPPPFK
jgi:hypothetical protein